MGQSNKPFAVGKLPIDYLARLLESFSIQDPRVVLGPRLGEDAAVLDMGDRLLVAKTDPITFATEAIGWYAVHVNANDVACMGAEPRWFLATLLLPEGRADAEMVDQVFEQILRACQEVGATLVGGHTEITYSLDRPIVLGAMLGEVEPQNLVTTSGARPGDVVLLTQRVAVEGTAIIAREKREELSERHGLSAEYLDHCAGFIYQPGISIVPAARAAMRAAPIHAMHDPTEGGLATGLWELAQAAGVGLEIDEQAVPIYPETRLLCDIYGLDPWGLIASGSLLLTLPPADAGRVVDALGQAGIEAAVIGRVVSQEEGATLLRAESIGPLPARRNAVKLPAFPRDEIARLFE